MFTFNTSNLTLAKGLLEELRAYLDECQGLTSVRLEEITTEGKPVIRLYLDKDLDEGRAFGIVVDYDRKGRPLQDFRCLYQVSVDSTADLGKAIDDLENTGLGRIFHEKTSSGYKVFQEVTLRPEKGDSVHGTAVYYWGLYNIMYKHLSYAKA